MDIFNKRTVQGQIARYNQHSASSQLIYLTLLLKEDLKYYTKIRNLVVRRVYYGVNLLPFKLYDFYQSHPLDAFPDVFQVVSDDIAAHIDGLNGEIARNYRTLGRAINSKDSPIDSTKDADGALKGEDAGRWRKPSFLRRHWAAVALAVVVGPVLSLLVVRNRLAILDWVNTNARDLAYGFVRNWIVAPMKDVASTIKLDANIISAKDSLSSSLGSLERMTQEYLTDMQVDVDASELHNQIQSGDFTLLMSKYELEMRHPIKNLVLGSLVRNLLIQVQKTKVDGDLVISGIDKLIKSQQLLLAVVSISPSLFLLYQAVKYSLQPSFTVNGKDLKKSCLENLVSLKQADDDESTGLLLVNSINLKIEARYVLAKDVFAMFARDLDRLVGGEDVLTKVYVVYGAYFR